MSHLRKNAPLMVWLIAAAMLMSWSADGFHNHSLRVVESPELAAEPEAGWGHCVIDQFLSSLQGGNSAPAADIAIFDDSSPSIPTPAILILAVEPTSDASPRAPPVSL